MQFTDFNKVVAKQFQAMTKISGGLFYVEVDKDALWAHYLASFPEGSNPIYVKNTEHDCSCCRHFIKTLGSVVAIKATGELTSIWDVMIDGPYQVVANQMAAFVTQRADTLLFPFLSSEPSVGVAKNFQQLLEGGVKQWEHFHVTLPAAVIVKGTDIGPQLSNARATYDVMYRGLTELSLDAVDSVLELIAQNSLYRGEEQKFALTEFRKLKVAFDKVADPQKRKRFCWTQIKTGPQSVTRLRNTAVGTLLTDLSTGMDLEDAVRAFERMVAPTNYKRPTALVTKAMIQKAQETIQELGLTSALERRYATLDDITINNLLFADRTAKQQMNVFDELSARVSEPARKLDKVEEVPIEVFLQKILPSAKSLEVMFENHHAGNLVSLIGPADPTAKLLFKWPNPFSWSYAGELTDSIKERVKKAGGSVTGDFRASLSWFNYDDLDLHLVEPSGTEICFMSKYSHMTGGQLDVDMNAGGGTTRSAVENITYPSRTRMREGIYTLSVVNYSKRESIDIGFDVEIEFDGTTYTFAYAKSLATQKSIIVCKFKYSRVKGLEIVESLPATQASRVVWGVPTQTFHRINVIMLSPNYWDDNVVGNKHYFFMLDGCQNEDKARGFFNEFLTEALTPHRKVFEMVGSKMRTDESDRQLSGVGFSSTQRNSLLCRVQGALTRTIRITF